MLFRYRIWIALLIAAVLGGSFYYSYRLEKELSGDYCGKRKPGRTTVAVNPLALPLYLSTMLVMFFIGSLAMGDFSLMRKTFYTVLTDVCLLMSLYFVLLMLIMPFLRRVISAKACATMWMIPSVLYIGLYRGYSWNIRPRFVFVVEPVYLNAALIIWGLGFFAVLIWHIVSHLIFRRRCMEGAKVITGDVYMTWKHEMWRAEIKGEIPLMSSLNVETPMVIGVFRRSLVALMPAYRQYSEDELKLIFRHELLHVQRCDVQTKIYMLFCTALCWFVPFAWIALRKLSEDLELSCDELVLNDAEETARRRYAELILKTGSSRGFSTCLSAADGTMRYRLRSIMNPAKKISGVLLLAVSGGALVFALGTVGFASQSGTVRELMRSDMELEELLAPAGSANYIHTQPAYDEETAYAWNKQEIIDYIGSLKAYKMVSEENYESRQGFELWEIVEKGIWRRIADLDENSLVLRYPDGAREYFLLKEEPSWTFIEARLDFTAPNPDPAPVWPELMMYFDGLPEDEPMYAVRDRLIIHDAEGSHDRSDESGPGGVHGAEVSSVRFEFNYAPEYYTVSWESLDGENSGRIDGEELENGEFQLCSYSAHYTVEALFYSNRDTAFDAAFIFDVVLPEDMPPTQY